MNRMLIDHRRIRYIAIDRGPIRFIGMTGGAIFHEMMKRQGVKNICTQQPSPIISVSH